MSQDAAVEVWKEIQQYLRNLCLSSSAAQQLAKNTAETLKLNSKNGKPFKLACVKKSKKKIREKKIRRKRIQKSSYAQILNFR